MINSSNRILAGSVAVLQELGLENWSIDRVAREAGCTKGLVFYHFGDRITLLRRTAASLAERVHQGRMGVLHKDRGAVLLDMVWAAREREVQERTFGALLALAGARDAEVRRAALPSPEALAARTDRLCQGLGFPRGVLSPFVVESVLTGLQVLLSAGEEPAEIREHYDAFWLDTIRQVESV